MNSSEYYEIQIKKLIIYTQLLEKAFQNTMAIDILQRSLDMILSNEIRFSQEVEEIYKIQYEEENEIA